MPVHDGVTDLVVSTLNMKKDEELSILSCLDPIDFFNGYRDGDPVFYISATDFKWDFQFVDDETRASWSPNWIQANAVFESQLDSNPSFTSYKNKIFFIWDGNHIFFCLKKIILTAYI